MDQNSTNSMNPEQESPKTGLWVAVTVLLTAVLIGGGVYVWQQSRGEPEEPAVKNITYLNDPQDYSIKYPNDIQISDYSLYNGSKVLHQIGFKNDSVSFTIRVNEEAENEFYLDQTPTSKTTLGGLPANFYVSKTGYGDAGGFSAPYTAVKTYKNGKSYVIEFNTTEVLTGTYRDILNSFQFIR